MTKFHNKSHILHRREKDIAKWLQDRALPDNEFLCVDNNGQFIHEDKINEYLVGLCQQVNMEPIAFSDFVKDEKSNTNS